jgi:hypothetical protein
MKKKIKINGKKTEHTAAILTIRDAGKMSYAGRNSVAQWLRKCATELVNKGDKYSSGYRAKYIYLK